MNRKRQLLHLIQAEAHVATSLRHIARQEEIIAAFTMRGDDTAQARSILATFEQALRLHEDHVALVRNELRSSG
jgi:ATP-dependent protease HslVU (ClpYQ) peptidase subunit